MPSRMFFDDFSAYGIGTLPLTKWGQVDTRIMAQVVATATDGGLGPHSGTRMMRCNYNGSVPLSNDSSYETATFNASPLYNQEFFMRVWMRPDSNFQATPGTDDGAHLMRFFQQTPYNDFLTSYLTGGMSVDINIDGVRYFPVISFGPPGASQWHKFEWYFNRTTGTAKTWFNGSLGHNHNGDIVWGSQRFQDFEITSNWGSPSPDSINHIYFDDVELFSDLNTGTPVTGSMSAATIQAIVGGDVTPPAAPTGVTVS